MAIDSAQYRVTLCSIILLGTWLRAVWYCAESISKNSSISAKTKTNMKIFQPIPQCTGQTQIIKRTGRKSCLAVLLKRIRKSHLTPYSMILRGTWLRAVSYCAELDSAQYDTAQNLTPRSMILRRVNLEKLEYLGENETKYENISTHSSVYRADSNYKKNR